MDFHTRISPHVDGVVGVTGAGASVRGLGSALPPVHLQLQLVAELGGRDGVPPTVAEVRSLRSVLRGDPAGSVVDVEEQLEGKVDHKRS